MKRKTIRNIILSLLAVLVLLAGVLFAVGYFYYSKIIRTYLIETVAKESKKLYQVEIGNISLNILDGNLTIDRFSLLPDTAAYRTLSKTDTLSNLLFRLTINQFRIRGFRVMDALRHRKVDVTRIRFIAPEVTVFRMKLPVKPASGKPPEVMMSIPLPKSLSSIRLTELIVENAKLEFVDCSRDSITRSTFPVCNIFVKNILVDSAHQGRHRIFNADVISVKLGGYSITPGNGMNKFSYGEIGLSTGSGELYVRDLHLEPLYNRHDYSRKLGYQTDWIDVRVNKLRLARINLRELLAEGKLNAGLLEIDSLVLVDHLDKRVAERPGMKPPMPQDALRKLKAYLRIDTVALKNGKATYEEQTGPSPGTLFFDKMSVTFTGLTNDNLLLNAGLVSELKGTAYLMGKGKLDATLRFRFGDPRNTFSFSAMVGPTDLPEINPMLSKLMPAKVVSGKLKKLVVPMVYANDDYAQGKLLFYYNDLSVSVVDQKHTFFSKIKTGVINWAANDLIVNNDNPTKSGKMKTGVIHFRRDKSASIFNYLWKSVLSGLKSTMGFNSKAQKELLKAEKAQK